MFRRLVLLLAACVVLPAAVHAKGGSAGASSYGPRVGVSVDPDQLVLGGQFSTGEIAPSVSFDPNAELGIGDDQTVIAINLDGHYHFALRGSSWSPYLGFGVGVNFFSFDRPAPFQDESETDVGGNFILGAAVPTNAGSQFFTEMKLGLGDIPSLKIMAGWNFGMR